MSTPTLEHTTWIKLASHHWKQHQPRRYKMLIAEGKLPSALRAAAADTSRDLQVLRDQGLDQEHAWEMVRVRHLFLPDEQGASREVPLIRPG